MDMKEEFRNLVTKKCMRGFNYGKWYGFQTVFYESSYSYICCPCGFEHEFLDYIEDSGDLNEDIYEKIIQSIIDGKCPHTGSVSKECVRETGLTALLISAGVGTEPTKYTQHFEKRTLKSGYIQAGIFKQNMYQIAFNKRKYKNCCYYFQHYINDYIIRYPFLVNGFLSEKIPKLFKPIKTAEIYQISNVPYLEAFIRTGNKSLLETALGLTAEFGERIQIRHGRECEAFHFTVKNGLTDLAEFFLEYVKQTNDTLLTDYCKRYANMYNLPETLNRTLEEKLSATKPKETVSSLIHILKKQQQCRKTFRNEATERYYQQELDNNLRNNDTSQTSASSAEKETADLTELLEEFYEDFKGEIMTALKQIPNVTEEYKKYLDKNLMNTAKTPHIVKAILDLGVTFDNTDIPGEDQILVRIVKNLNMYANCVRDTVKLLVRASPDLKHLDEVIPLALRQDICTYRMKPYRTPSDIYRADIKEHGLFGSENDYFALNFAVPFFLECGFPTTRSVLNSALDADLHPSEHAYIEQYLNNPNPLKERCDLVEGLYLGEHVYIEEYIINHPKPLQIRCREVLHKYHKGAEIDNFMDQSDCPQQIKEFVLLKSLHHQGSEAHTEAHKTPRDCRYCKYINPPVKVERKWENCN